MIREFARLYELTVRELLAAGRRIEQQSGLVLRARLRLRKWCKRWRRMRRKQRQTSSVLNNGSVAERYCEWIASKSKYGRLYWQCKYCGRTALRPSTRHEQKYWGQSCPDAPAKEVANGKH